MSLTDSTPSPSNSVVELCQVCDQNAHGNHFGVLTCRACAVFFRRTVTGPRLAFPCLKQNDKCKANAKGRFNCRKCRLKRCYDAGMSPEKFQFDHDLPSSSSSFPLFDVQGQLVQPLVSTIPFSMETFLGRPHFIICLEVKTDPVIKQTADFGFMLEKASEIFKKGTAMNSNVKQLNCLGKLTYALSRVRKEPHGPMQQLGQLGKTEFFTIMEDDFLTVTKWMTYCDGFQNLPSDTKLEIVKCIWYIWSRLERVIATAEMRMKKICSENWMMVTENTEVNFNVTDFDVSWFTNCSKEQISFFLEIMDDNFADDIVQQLIKLNPSQTEKTYMMFQTCVQFAGKTFQGNVLEMTDELIKKVADDLHEYYIKEMKLANYSARVAKMMKISNSILRNWMIQMERKSIGRVFDVFTLDFSHPEMYYGYNH